MKLEQTYWSRAQGWRPAPPGALGGSAQLVLVFGARAALQHDGVLDGIRAAYPGAWVTGCSTAGEIRGLDVFDDTVVVTAAAFEHASISTAAADLSESASIEATGALLGERLAAADLRHVLLLSDGLHVNGSELLRGLTGRLPEGVAVTGGLAADGSAFGHTVVLVDGVARDRVVVGIGLHGDRIRIGAGSVGGWDPFGPERVVTRSRGSVLHELDGQSALGLYRRYLGDHAAELPASGLLFPLSIRSDRDRPGVVRTILAVSDVDDTMTFAGDIPEGSYARLMRANFDRLIDGAGRAAGISAAAMAGGPPELALLISCVGRKMVLRQRVEEEVEGVRDVVGPGAVLAGFYSYGEISPFTPSATCELHNQTMTVTTLREV